MQLFLINPKFVLWCKQFILSFTSNAIHCIINFNLNIYFIFALIF